MQNNKSKFPDHIRKLMEESIKNYSPEKEKAEKEYMDKVYAEYGHLLLKNDEEPSSDEVKAILKSAVQDVKDYKDFLDTEKEIKEEYEKKK